MGQPPCSASAESARSRFWTRTVRLIGVVSEADLLVKEAVADEPNVVWGFLAGIVHHAARAKAGAARAKAGESRRPT